METDVTKYFQEALRHFLKKKGHGAQSWLARKTGIGQQYISKIASSQKKVHGSEMTRRKLAKGFGYEYEEFLAVGRDLLEGKTPDKKTAEPDHAPKLKAIPNHEEDSSWEDLFDEFRNKAMALELNRYILGIEKYSPERLQAVRDMLKGMYEGVKPVESKKLGNDG